MSDPKLAELLKWGVENSGAPHTDSTSESTPDASRGLSADALSALLGGPSDADRMRDAMAAILSTEVDLKNKLIAFDNLEQLIEGIDNANNMESLGLWTPLVQQLQHKEADMRKMAAWCLGTAVQNNPKAQERLLIVGAIPTLVDIAIKDNDQTVRKKAILALSSGVRNYQPGLDEAIKHMPEDQKPGDKLDAADMDSVDTMIQKLRDNSEQHH